MYKVQHLHVKDYSVTVIVVFFFLKKCKLDAGGTDEDDVLDDPVSKKKGSSSNSNQNAGKRSRKVMTEVNIARYQFNLSIFSCLSDTCSCPDSYLLCPNAHQAITKFDCLLSSRHISMLVVK